MSTTCTTAIVLRRQASDTRAKYAGAQADLVNELGGTLRIAAALRASHYPNTGAPLPDLLESVEAPSGGLASHLRTARAAAAAAEQSLREELLTNDSLGG
ncbi:MAG TPA: hypothetical protein VIU38_07680 [Anaerolineales bacterium]